jgi:hypothetical protein
MLFSLEVYVIFNSAVLAYLEQNECFSPFKSLMGMQHCFKKLTQFSQGNNVIDAPASNIDVFIRQTHAFLKIC